MITYMLSLESTIYSTKTGNISSYFDSNLKSCGDFYQNLDNNPKFVDLYFIKSKIRFISTHLVSQDLSNTDSTNQIK